MINQFHGEFRWLSNFYPSPMNILIDGEPVRCRTVEHAYQALKSKTVEEQISIIQAATPGKAKRAGRAVHQREDWEGIKLGVMRNLLRQKFRAGSVLAQKLVETQDEELIEGNTWGDIFWGVSLETGQGLNMLGKMLMQIRTELKQQESTAAD